MSEPRQPVKGKPHISPFVGQARVTLFVRPHAGFLREEVLALDRWEDAVRASWNEWWRQHQEAA